MKNPRPKFDDAACMRSMLLLERHFQFRAQQCAAEKDKQLLRAYTEDAADVRRVYLWFSKKRYVTAIRTWRNLDSFVRDYFPRRTINFLAKQAIQQYEAKNGKATCSR